MTARGYELDEALRQLKEVVRRNDLKASRIRPASGVSFEDDGGFFGGGDITLQDILNLIGAGTLPDNFLLKWGGGKGNVQALGTLGATETIDLANGNYFAGELDDDCDISTTGWTNLKDCQITVELTGDGTSTPTFLGVTFIGSAPGVIGLGDVLHVILFSRDGGTTQWGAIVGGSGGSVAALDDLTDVVVTSPAEDDDLRFDGSMWVNDARKWEAVTDGEDVFVWVSDDLVHDWST